MAMLVLDSWTEQRVKAEREVSGADRYDEIWDGVYVVVPVPDNEHQDIRTGLAIALQTAVGFASPVNIYAGVNLSDRVDDFLFNCRVPDVALVYPDGAASDCGTHYCGGPDFCVEIVTSGDRSRDKLPFYAAVGVRELLLIDRDPWTLELYRLAAGRLELAGTCDLAASNVLASYVVPASFGLVHGDARPTIEVAHRDGVQRWLV
jgi:Uma2 family endonuclease